LGTVSGGLAFLGGHETKTEFAGTRSRDAHSLSVDPRSREPVRRRLGNGHAGDVLRIIGIDGYRSPRSRDDDLREKQLPLNPISHHEMMTTDEY
jgi:hypothetical protein